MQRSNRSYSGSFSASLNSLWPAGRKQRADVSLLRSNVKKEEPKVEDPEKAKKIFHISVILAVILCFGMLFSIFAPFFPAEAAKKGMSPTVVGLLFGIFELVVFILSPFWGILAPKIGFKFLIASGMFMAGGATILFGLLDMAPDGSVYIGLCFACRIVEAMGVSMYITAAFAYGSSLYPDDVAFIYGLLETFNGAGFMAGPPLGGLLFKAGGFMLPFFFMGGLILVLGSISTILLKSNDEEASDTSLSPFLLLKMPLVIILSISEAVCAMIFAFLDPTLSIFLSRIGITDPVVVGAIFMVCSIAYTIACLITGKMVDKLDAPYTFMVVGAALTCIGYLLLGPSPIIAFFEPNVATIIIACIIGFAGLGFLMIPIPKLLTETLQEYGFPAEIETNSLVSGVYNCVWYFGSFIGPTAAGAMVEGIGFVWSSTVMAFLAAAVAILLLITAGVMKSEFWKMRGQFRYAAFMVGDDNSSLSSSDGERQRILTEDDDDDDSILASSNNENFAELESGELMDNVGELRAPESFQRNRTTYGAISNEVV